MRTSRIISLFAILIIVMVTLSYNSCNKKEETPSNTVPVLTTKNASEVTNATAKVGGVITASGGTSVTERGVCYSKSSGPTVADNTETSGSGTGTFESTLTGLDQSTKYYFKAYAINSVGIGYGDQKSFTTLGGGGGGDLPTVITSTVSNITETSASCGGNVSDQGSSSVTARGVCWSTSSNPTISDSYTTNGSGTGSFTSNITGLTASTSYYVRAYATNSAGTAYGNEESITTQGGSGGLPTVTTDDATNITQTTSTSGGNVTDQGSSSVIARGVCWSTSPYPTTSDSHTTDGSGAGGFTSNITGLSAGTIYNVRAYATNSSGTVYGNRQFFSTQNGGGMGCQGVTSVSYQGQVYHTVEIGGQCWFKENLNYNTGNSWCYEDSSYNCDIFGRLYDWETIMNGASSSNSVPSGVQGICPQGWHVPSDEEWKILEGTVDTQYGVGDPEWDEREYRGFDAGKHLKSTTGWFNNENGDNSSGFTALPGGYKYGGNFYALSKSATFWSSRDAGISWAWLRHIYYSSDEISRYYYYQAVGKSLRCIKD